MLNAQASRAEKEAGMQLSIMFEGEWAATVMVELAAWLATRRAQGRDTMTLEQFRHHAIAQPHSHKAWGSLPALACRAGLILPMTHGDGSPVMRRAESEKTHAHPVRVWRIAPPFSGEAAGEEAASLSETRVAEARRQPIGVDGRGHVLHGERARAEV